MGAEPATLPLETGCGLRRGLRLWSATLSESIHQQSNEQGQEEESLPQARS